MTVARHVFLLKYQPDPFQMCARLGETFPAAITARHSQSANVKAKSKRHLEHPLPDPNKMHCFPSTVKISANKTFRVITPCEALEFFPAD